MKKCTDNQETWGDRLHHLCKCNIYVQHIVYALKIHQFGKNRLLNASDFVDARCKRIYKCWWNSRWHTSYTDKVKTTSHQNIRSNFVQRKNKLLMIKMISIDAVLMLSIVSIVLIQHPNIVDGKPCKPKGNSSSKFSQLFQFWLFMKLFRRLIHALVDVHILNMLSVAFRVRLKATILFVHGTTSVVHWHKECNALHLVQNGQNLVTSNVNMA